MSILCSDETFDEDIILKKIKDIVNSDDYDIDYKDDKGYTAAIYAFENKYFIIFEYLVSIGSNVKGMIHGKYDDGDEFVCTLFHILVSINAHEMVSQLIDLGVDINAKDNSGCTPINYSVELGYV